jgi:hypothetical protein
MKLRLAQTTANNQVLQVRPQDQDHEIITEGFKQHETGRNKL